MGTIVSKFGGVPMADSGRIASALDIFGSDPRRRVAVVSMFGKRHPSDRKGTDLLLDVHKLRSEGRPYGGPWLELRDRFEEVHSGLGLRNFDLGSELEQVRRRIDRGAPRDYVASRGEFLAAKMFAAASGAEFVDAGRLIFFGRDGRIDDRCTDRAIRALCGGSGRYVIPGFYGSTPWPWRRVRTFSRGGSDVTDALVARALDAELCEKWTDVAGLYQADPRIVPAAGCIRLITHAELEEMSYGGGCVIHEDAMAPLVAKSIPLSIRNAFNLGHPGTLVVSSRPDHGRVVGISGRTGFKVLTIATPRMNSAVGFVHEVLGVLRRLQVPFEHMPTGLYQMSLVVADRHLGQGRWQKILGQLGQMGFKDIQVDEDLALVCLVGLGAFQGPATLAAAFGSLATAGISSRLVSLGAGDISVVLGVGKAEYEKAIRVLHGTFLD